MNRQVTRIIISRWAQSNQIWFGLSAEIKAINNPQIEIYIYSYCLHIKHNFCSIKTTDPASLAAYDWSQKHHQQHMMEVKVYQYSRIWQNRNKMMKIANDIHKTVAWWSLGWFWAYLRTIRDISTCQWYLLHLLLALHKCQLQYLVSPAIKNKYRNKFFITPITIHF